MMMHVPGNEGHSRGCHHAMCQWTRRVQWGLEIYGTSRRDIISHTMLVDCNTGGQRRCITVVRTVRRRGLGMWEDGLQRWWYRWHVASLGGLLGVVFGRWRKGFAVVMSNGDWIRQLRCGLSRWNFLYFL